jgi:NADPH2:quinone reductase
VKAVRMHDYGGPDVLVYEEVEKPAPGARQVLVRVRAASVNPVDVSVRENRFPTPRKPPKIIGSDGAGTVETIGREVTTVEPGEDVFFSGLGIGSEGSYAEYALLAEEQAVPKPATLSFVEAAAMGLVFPAAYYALVDKAHVEAGETVLVQGGAGGVGSAAVQLAKVLGARVLATVSNRAGADLVTELGVDDVIDRTKEDVAARVRELTDDRGANVIVELATVQNIGLDVTVVAKDGRIACIGQGKGAEAVVPIGAAQGRGASLLFLNLANAGRAGTARIMREIGQLVEEGRIAPVIGEELPLADARRAHELLAGPHLGKIVLVP